MIEKFELRIMIDGGNHPVTVEAKWLPLKHATVIDPSCGGYYEIIKITMNGDDVTNSLTDHQDDQIEQQLATTNGR